MESILNCSSRPAEREHGRKRLSTNGGTSEWQKNAIRVCGNWSEQLSSKGKIYFYNCITEVSQWHKPPEWNLPNMDERELYERIAERSDANARNLKRARLHSSNLAVARTTPNHLMDSPKRIKYSHDFPYSKLDRQRSTLPPHSGTRNSVLGGQNTAEHSAKLHDGGQRNHQDCEYGTQNRKYSSNYLESRSMAKVDDMEISPNSSPMSGGSSPANTCSPQKVGYQSTSNRREVTQRTSNVTTRDEATKSSSIKLRQLLETIHNLLDQSSGHSTQRNVAESPPTNNGILNNNRKRIPYGVHPSVSTPEHKRYSPKRTPDVHSASRQAIQNSPANTRLPPVSSTTVCHADVSENISAFNNAMQEYNSATTHIKNTSGLASTLSTLANLIDNSRDQNPFTAHNPIISTTVSSSSVSNNLAFPTPNQSFASQRLAGSPIIPSPKVTNTTSFSLSGNAVTHSDSSQKCSLSSQKVNALISNLRSLTQQTQTSSISQQVDGNHGSIPHNPKSDFYLQPNGSIQFSTKSAVDAQFLSALESKDGIDHSSHIHDLVKVLQSALGRKAEPKLENAPGYSQDSPAALQSSHVQSDISPTSALDRMDWRSPARNVSLRNEARPGLNHTNCTQSSSASPFKGHSNLATLDQQMEIDSVECTDAESAPSLEQRLHAEANRVLESAETQRFVDSRLVSRYHDQAVERMESEAHSESRKFDRLQSVLFGELSVESKKLRALVRISEAKLAIHKEKQTSSRELMDAIENRRQFLSTSFAGDL